MDYDNKKELIFHNNTRLYFVAICFLTYSQPALPCIGLCIHSCSLLELVGSKVTYIFNKLQLAALPAIQETFLRFDRVEKDKSFTQKFNSPFQSSN